MITLWECGTCKTGAGMREPHFRVWSAKQPPIYISKVEHHPDKVRDWVKEGKALMECPCCVPKPRKRRLPK